MVRGETWEFWQGFREIGMLRCKNDSGVIDFHGEWLGWDQVPTLYFEVEIPAQVDIGGHRLEASEINALAGRMHLVLCSMQERNAVVQNIRWPPLPGSDRDRLLSEFQQWMEQRGWKVAVSRSQEKITIRPNGFWVFRRNLSETEILEQGAWVATAWHALLDKEVNRTTLFVSEGARQTSHWLAELSW